MTRMSLVDGLNERIPAEVPWVKMVVVGEGSSY
jgi:hypothetical protein